MRLYASLLETFPPPESALEEGLLAISDDVSVQRLLEAYSFGIFPWPQPGYPTLRFSPPERGVLDFADFHVSKSLAKWLRKAELRFTWNQCFIEVMKECALTPRPRQTGAWITPRLLKAYFDFHQAGYAHSLECWRGSKLVGGLYGVYVAGVFCGESMFFKESNASKACLVAVVEFLKRQGFHWMDIQMVTPGLASMGGKLISRAEFLERLEAGKKAAKSIRFQFEKP